jgi:AP-1 complex subunit gamma-1
MGLKLKELIRAVRKCKTAADERGVITKECALIRTAIKNADKSKAEDVAMHRNCAKLMYIQMLGYPTHFGQMAPLKLIATPNFPEKRLGYLTLMALLDENTQVLMLVTNSLKNDLEGSVKGPANNYVVGLALTVLGDISSTDMCRDLANEVERLFTHENAYVRKKATLCGT